MGIFCLTLGFPKSDDEAPKSDEIGGDCCDDGFVFSWLNLFVLVQILILSQMWQKDFFSLKMN